VARILIVPCGARGQALARELRGAGHAVRGTTRGAHVTEIAATGAEPYVGDPDRIGTLMDALYGVTIVVWSTPPGLDTGRVRMLWEKLVDTGVRGVVHSGTGEEIARASSDTWQIPLEVIDGEDDGISAVSRLLGYTRT
jgi:hypothetical protein